MADSSSVGVTAAGSVTTGFQIGYNNLYASSATAINVGTLTADASSLNVLSRITEQAPQDYYSFNFNSGDAIKLAFNNLTATTDLRVQLYDVAGNVVADNHGTDDQQAAYTNLTSQDGLTASTGQYYVKVSYASGAKTYGQDYNFQLYSGTTYSSSLVTTALTQSYDPNLFSTVSSTILAATNVTLYNRTATLASTASATTATNVNTVSKNQSALNVLSTLTQSNPTQDFNVNVGDDGPLKFSFTNSTNTSNLHIKLYDSTGTKVIADSEGTADQQYAYKQLNSGAGLQTSKGHYIVQVSYDTNQVRTSQNFNFQVYSGNGYNNFFTTSTVAPAKSSLYGAGTNLNVYAQASATTGTNNSYNTINATPADAVFAGWLKDNTTSLDIVSRLTKDDNANYFSFTYQQGTAFKLQVNNLTSNDALHIQLLDPTGNSVIADNEGTPDQVAAFNQWTSDSGIAGQAGNNYLIKTEYGKNADKTKQTDYSLQLFSGSLYTQQYKTYASAQTLGNFFLGGGSLGNSSASGTAAFLGSLFNSDDSSILSALV